MSQSLRDEIGRALYEEPGQNREWAALAEERRTPWRQDADRILGLLKEPKLRTRLARRLRREIEDHGGVDEFCTKLISFPDQYITDLAVAAADELATAD